MGDLVVIQDLNAVRGQWRKGKVIGVIRGSDQKVRSVKLRYRVLSGLGSYDGVKDSVESRDVKNIVVIVPNEDRKRSGQVQKDRISCD